MNRSNLTCFDGMPLTGGEQSCCGAVSGGHCSGKERQGGRGLGELEERRAWATLSEGCYLLRSNITGWEAEQLWQAYIQLN